jgi:hypothetical protein
MEAADGVVLLISYATCPGGDRKARAAKVI